jgi:hypothetical protein
VSTAASLDIGLNTRDVRSLLSAPIEDLEDVVAKSRPSQLRGYGAMDGMVSQMLEQWCASAGACLSTLVCVVQHTSAPPVTCIPSDHSFPEMLPLSRYQRNALGAYLQVANDTYILLERLLQLARAPYPALYSSSLTDHDLACCQATCTNLAILFEQGHR